MTTTLPVLTTEQLAAVSAAADEHRARATALRWAAHCEDMEAVLDDLAVALLPHPKITHLVGRPCEGIDCRYEPCVSLTDYGCVPHLHFDSVVISSADVGPVQPCGPRTSCGSRRRPSSTSR